MRKQVAGYMAHRVIAAHQDATRNALIASSSMLTCYGIGDYMQKWLPRKHACVPSALNFDSSCIQFRV